MKLPKHVKIVLKKQHEVLGLDFSSFKGEEGWYSKHTWTKEQEEGFRKWFIDYLCSNPEARLEIMAYPTKNKKAIEGTWRWWNLDYGWKHEKVPD